MADHLLGNRTTVTGADPSGKPRRIMRSGAPLPYRFDGSEPNGEIKILDAETIKGLTHHIVLLQPGGITDRDRVFTRQYSVPFTAPALVGPGTPSAPAEHYAKLIDRKGRYGRFRHASSLPKTHALPRT